MVKKGFISLSCSLAKSQVGTFHTIGCVIAFVISMVMLPLPLPLPASSSLSFVFLYLSYLSSIFSFPLSLHCFSLLSYCYSVCLSLSQSFPLTSLFLSSVLSLYTPAHHSLFAALETVLSAQCKW